MSYQPAVSAMWLEAFFAAVVFRDLYNGIVQQVVRIVFACGIEAGADGGDGQCGDS